MAVVNAFAQDVVDLAEPLTLDAAYARSCHAALADSQIGVVGLEIETHLVDLDAVADAVAWHRAEPVTDIVAAVASACAVTLEPGGQLELSGPPQPDIAAAVAGLRHDWVGARLALAERKLGVAYAGADPLRPSRRINPRPRYRAMEQHFAATGRAAAGAVMMNSTAALQVNLQSGPKRGWPERVARAYRLGPTLVAISAARPGCTVGQPAGSRSASRPGAGSIRAHAVRSLAASRQARPRTASWTRRRRWANYAMRAPVVLVRTRGDDVEAVRTPVSFGQWASGAVPLGSRAPTAADLETHLTTLFPPVRLRGYLELRYLDATAPRWWPAIAAVLTTLMDDPVAADLATEATERTATRWTEAARAGLGDQLLAQSARRCLSIAAGRIPAELAPAVADLAELVESRRCPGDLLAARIQRIGPQAALEELAHA